MTAARHHRGACLVRLVGVAESEASPQPAHAVPQPPASRDSSAREALFLLVRVKEVLPIFPEALASFDLPGGSANEHGTAVDVPTD